MREEPEPEFRQCPVGSPDHLATVALRYDSLRAPFGIDWRPGELEEDTSDRHFGLFQRSNAIAIVVAKRLPDGTVKLRQIAVQERMRGKGLGRRIMLAVETELRKEGISQVVLHSREHVIGFYAALGYAKDGDRFEEVGIPHFRMVKTI